MTDNGTQRTLVASQTFRPGVVALFGQTTLEKQIILDAIERLPGIQVIGACYWWTKPSGDRRGWGFQVEIVYRTGR